MLCVRVCWPLAHLPSIRSVSGWASNKSVRRSACALRVRRLHTPSPFTCVLVCYSCVGVQLLKLAAFPMVFLCIWFVPVIARLAHSATTDEDKPAAGPVPVITALLAPSQGWVNAIVYTCINRSVMAQVVTTLGCAKCCRRGGSPPSSQHSQATPHRPGPSNAPYSQMA